MDMGIVSLAIIFLLLCLLICLIIIGFSNRKPKKKLNDFEENIIKMSERFVVEHIGSASFRGIPFLEAAVERDEQSEILFQESIKFTENIHITKYIWHYGVMLFTIKEYRAKIAKAKLDRDILIDCTNALDSYMNAICDILRFILSTDDAKKCAAVVCDVLDGFGFETGILTLADNVNAKVVNGSISIAKKVKSGDIKLITNEELIYGSMWFGRANYLEAFGYDRLSKTAEQNNQSVLIAYSLYDDEVEMLIATYDMKFYAYKRINYETKEETEEFSTRVEDFPKYIHKTAKSSMVKSSI